MKVILDLIPLKSGGGAQVGLGLVEYLEEREPDGTEFVVLTTKGTEVDRRICNSRRLRRQYRVNPSVASRVHFERTILPALLQEVRPGVIYSQFGAGIPGYGVPVVAGCAYSNLFYPEIDFWREWPPTHRIVHRLRDRLRLRRMLGCDGWIFETDNLARRAITMYNLPPERVTVVRPSVSPYVSLNAGNAVVRSRCDALPAGYRVLLLTGWHHNKGLAIIPRVAWCLRYALGVKDVRFVITISNKHPEAQKLREEAVRMGVRDSLVFFGPVPADGCAELYRATDSVMLLSLLESFSNNIIEAWTMERPLIISRAEWAIAICGDAALYVDRSDPMEIAEAVKDLATDGSLGGSLVANGRRARQAYPSLAEKIENYLAFVAKIAAVGPRTSRSGGPMPKA